MTARPRCGGGWRGSRVGRIADAGELAAMRGEASAAGGSKQSARGMVAQSQDGLPLGVSCAWLVSSWQKLRLHMKRS